MLHYNELFEYGQDFGCFHNALEKELAEFAAEVARALAIILLKKEERCCCPDRDYGDEMDDED